jgi:hypothetical protein
VAVEPVGEIASQRVVEHQAVGTVHALQLLKLESLPLTTGTGGEKTGGNCDDGKGASHLL